jgi:hypothetical protein
MFYRHLISDFEDKKGSITDLKLIDLYRFLKYNNTNFRISLFEYPISVLVLASSIGESQERLKELIQVLNGFNVDWKSLAEVTGKDLILLQSLLEKED